MKKTKRAFRPMKREPLSLSQQVTIRSREKAVRVTIGNRFIWLPGQWKGNAFHIPSERIRRWGAADGPVVTADEKEMLMFVLTRKSAPSPYMRLIFEEGGKHIRYGFSGWRKPCSEKIRQYHDCPVKCADSDGCGGFIRI